MKNITKRGFTLVELLVVVLIIGILSAVALPQYQKAVFKSRLAGTATIVAAAHKALSVYVLEHGWGIAEPTSEDLDIQVCPSGSCNDKYFEYMFYVDCCDSGKNYYGVRVGLKYNADPVDNFAWIEINEDGSTSYYCGYIKENEHGKMMCEMLPKIIQGNWQVSGS